MSFIEAVPIINGVVLIFAVVVIVVGVLTIYNVTFVDNPQHAQFCDSLGLEFDGYPNGDGDAIRCTGVVDNKGVAKIFLVKGKNYFEVS